MARPTLARTAAACLAPAACRFPPAPTTTSTPRSRHHEPRSSAAKTREPGCRGCPSPPSFIVDRKETSDLEELAVQSFFHLSIIQLSTLVPNSFSPPSSSAPTPLVRPSTCLPLSPRTCNGSRTTKRRKQGGRRNASGDGERRKLSICLTPWRSQPNPQSTQWRRLIGRGAAGMPAVQQSQDDRLRALSGTSLQRPISGQLRRSLRRQSGADGIFRKQGRSVLN